MKNLRIATRTSQLALWQANHIKSKLVSLHPALIIDIIPIKTQGDIILDVSLAKIGGKGLFVKELEQALLNNEADIAVHSVKDMPAQLPKALVLAAYCSRTEARDALVSNAGLKLLELSPNPRLGTSSLRRQSQLKALRPDCDCKMLRGNVPTRVQKLKNGEYDAIILAAAGLQRLGLEENISQIFSVEELLPAVGQGALGIECRRGDKQVLELLAPLNDEETSLRVRAERAMNARLGGSCQVPIAGYAAFEDERLILTGRVADWMGTVILESKLEAGALEFPENLGHRVAEHLLEQGAEKLIQECLVE